MYSQNDIRCVRKENEKRGAEKTDLTTKIDEINLIDDTLDKDLKKLRLRKQVLTNNHSQSGQNYNSVLFFQWSCTKIAWDLLKPK